MSQSSEFYCRNPLCCFSTSACCCKRIFRYRLSPETFGYNLVLFTGSGGWVTLLSKLFQLPSMWGKLHNIC